MGAYGRDVLNENGKLLLGLVEDNKLSYQHIILHPQKWCLLHIQKCQPQQGASTFGLYPDKAGEPSTDPLYYVRRPPLEAPEESDHHLVYVKVRVPHRSAPNRRKRNSTKKTLKTADLKRLMAGPNLRCQVADAMVAALPPIFDGTYISDTATNMTDVLLSTAAELAPRS